nr:winged helix-turn-helix domain-containing protein [Qipengyuania algicida]
MPVDFGELLSDVWRLEHIPETNSLKVHVSRLRAKLGIDHAAWLNETVPQGGYRLGQRSSKSFFAFQDRHHALDSAQPNAHDACEDAGSVSGNHVE